MAVMGNWRLLRDLTASGYLVWESLFVSGESHE